MKLSSKRHNLKLLKVEVVDHQSIDGVHNIISRRELTGKELDQWKKDHGILEEAPSNID